MSASTLCLQFSNNSLQLLAALLLSAGVVDACRDPHVGAWRCASNLGMLAQLLAQGAGAAMPFAAFAAVRRRECADGCVAAGSDGALRLCKWVALGMFASPSCPFRPTAAV